MKKILTMPLAIAYEIIEEHRNSDLPTLSVLARYYAKVISELVYETYPDIDKGHYRIWNCIIDHREEGVFITLLTESMISEYTCKNDGATHVYLCQRSAETYYEQEGLMTKNELRRYIKSKRLPRK